ncbi:MAG: hypothetical protein AAGM67_17675, partial [Bacteroidota bacterium]
VRVASNGNGAVQIEKKKSLNEPKPASKSEPVPVAKPPSPTPVEEPKAINVATSNAAPIAQAPTHVATKTSPTPANTFEKARVKGTGLKGLGNLGSIQKAIEKRKAEQPVEAVEEEPQVYDINPSVTLAQEQFISILQQYIEYLKGSGKMNFASALEHGETRLEHNCWHYSVSNELSRQVIEKEKALLPYLRQQTGVKDLFLKLVVDEKVKRPEESIPYSPEEKLKVMGEKNPALNKLQEIFKTRIIY